MQLPITIDAGVQAITIAHANPGAAMGEKSAGSFAALFSQIAATEASSAGPGAATEKDAATEKTSKISKASKKDKKSDSDASLDLGIGKGVVPVAPPSVALVSQLIMTPATPSTAVLVRGGGGDDSSCGSADGPSNGDVAPPALHALSDKVTSPPAPTPSISELPMRQSAAMPMNTGTENKAASVQIEQSTPPAASKMPSAMPPPIVFVVEGTPPGVPLISRVGDHNSGGGTSSGEPTNTASASQQSALTAIQPGFPASPSLNHDEAGSVEREVSEASRTGTDAVESKTLGVEMKDLKVSTIQAAAGTRSPSSVTARHELPGKAVKESDTSPPTSTNSERPEAKPTRLFPQEPIAQTGVDPAANDRNGISKNSDSAAAEQAACSENAPPPTMESATAATPDNQAQPFPTSSTAALTGSSSNLVPDTSRASGVSAAGRKSGATKPEAPKSTSPLAARQNDSTSKSAEKSKLVSAMVGEVQHDGPGTLEGVEAGTNRPPRISENNVQDAAPNASSVSQAVPISDSPEGPKPEARRPAETAAKNDSGALPANAAHIINTAQNAADPSVPKTVMHFNLHSETLGDVSVRAVLQRSEVGATIEVHSQDARSLLEAGLPSLSRSLDDKGIEAGNFAILQSSGDLSMHAGDRQGGDRQEASPYRQQTPIRNPSALRGDTLPDESTAWDAPDTRLSIRA